MEPVTIIALFIAAAAIGVAAFTLIRNNHRTDIRADERGKQIGLTTERLVAVQAEIAGRLSQIAEADAANQKALSERLQNQ